MKLWVLAGCVWLLMCVPSLADSTSAMATPNAAVTNWLSQDAPLTCADVLFIAGQFLSDTELAYMQSLTDEECIAPIQELGISRQELVDYMRDEFWIPEYALATPNTDGMIIVPVPTFTPTASAEQPPAHPHWEPTFVPDHSHGPGGAVGQHAQYNGETYTFPFAGKTLGKNLAIFVQKHVLIISMTISILMLALALLFM